MPKSKFDSFPVSSFDEFKESFPLVLEYFRDDFNDTYGLGTDTKGSLDFTNNLADPASLTGTTSNTFTLDTDDTGGDVSLIFGKTNNEFLKWVDANSRFLLSDDLELTGDLLPTTDGTYDIGSTDLSWQNTYLTGSLFFDDTFEFTHDGTEFTLNDSLDITGDFTVSGIINANGGITSDDLTDTAWGIQNQNLLDKTDNETITGNWIHDGTFSLSTFTTGSVLFTGASGLVTEDNANLFWDNTNNRLGIGTITPSEKLSVIGNLLITDTEADNTNKVSQILSMSYDIDEENVSMLDATMTLGQNTIRWGGGNIAFNVASQQDFYTGSVNTTFGTIKLRIQEGNTIHNPNNIDHDLIIRDATSELARFNAGDRQLQMGDDLAIALGTGGRSTIVQDGTNLLIDPDVVGSGRLLVNNRDVKSMALMVR